MYDTNKNSFVNTAQEKRNIEGMLVYISFSKEESEGLKNSIRDILTDSFEKRYMESVAKPLEIN